MPAQLLCRHLIIFHVYAKLKITAFFVIEYLKHKNIKLGEINL